LLAMPNHVSPDARSNAGHGNNEASSSANLPPLGQVDARRESVQKCHQPFYSPN